MRTRLISTGNQEVMDLRMKPGEAKLGTTQFVMKKKQKLLGQIKKHS
jgi:hypothetical protein